jgi:hypothetical protein
MVSAGEKSIFQAFLDTCPDFAGRRLQCEPGADPPDFLGTDATGKRVGIELGEWLHPDQMAASKAREREEESFTNVLRSEERDPPENILFVVMGKEGGVALRDGDADQFRTEAFACVQEFDSRWPENRDWQGPQRIFRRDLAAYRCLAKYLTSLTFFPRRDKRAVRGVAWLTFEGRGGAYTPQWAIEALLRLLRKKVSKYGDLHKEQGLDELYLVAFYDQALIHNTPFFGVNFGWDQVAQIVGAEVAKNPGPFQRIFLFNALPQDRRVTLIWG